MAEAGAAGQHGKDRTEQQADDDGRDADNRHVGGHNAGEAGQEQAEKHMVAVAEEGFVPADAAFGTGLGFPFDDAAEKGADDERGVEKHDGGLLEHEEDLFQHRADKQAHRPTEAAADGGANECEQEG